MRYLVSYTLNPPRPNPGLEVELTRAMYWWHHIDFTWMVVTQETPAMLWGRLAPYLAPTDSLLIIQLPLSVRPTEQFTGWLPQEAWTWLEQTNFM